MTPAITLRFWDKVDLTGGMAACWPWKASRSGRGRGYGQFHYPRRTSHLAHRLAYELIVGPIPAGLTIDHLCRNQICCNPMHMEPVTNRENILRGDSPSAKAARKTHCYRGHPFTPENTIWVGYRKCRTCHDDWWARRRSAG